MKMIGAMMLVAVLSAGCGRNEESKITFRDSADELRHSDSDRVGGKDGIDPSARLRVVASTDASRAVGDSLTVKGIVADVVVNPKVTYLNFDKKFPSNTFSCAVFTGSLGGFGDLKMYKGRKVFVTGKITKYKGKPQMILWTQEQIKLAE